MPKYPPHEPLHEYWREARGRRKRFPSNWFNRNLGERLRELNRWYGRAVNAHRDGDLRKLKEARDNYMSKRRQVLAISREYENTLNQKFPNWFKKHPKQRRAEEDLGWLLGFFKLYVKKFLAEDAFPKLVEGWFEDLRRRGARL